MITDALRSTNKAALARHLRIAPSRLYQITHQPGAAWETVVAIAAYLGVPPETLANRHGVRYGTITDYGRWL